MPLGAWRLTASRTVCVVLTAMTRNAESSESSESGRALARGRDEVLAILFREDTFRGRASSLGQGPTGSLDRSIDRRFVVREGDERGLELSRRPVDAFRNQPAVEAAKR